MERHYYLHCQLKGWVYRIYSRNDYPGKREDKKKYVQRQAKEKNQCLYTLFCFVYFWGGMRVDTSVLHIDKSCYNMYDFTIILLVQVCYIPVFLMNFNLFAEGLLPPYVWQGHRDFVLKLFFNWSKITGIFSHIYAGSSWSTIQQIISFSIFLISEV